MVTLKPLGCLGTPRDCGLKLLEEASEACEALKEYGKAIEREQAAPKHVLDGSFARVAAEIAAKQALCELCDVLQVMTSCLNALGASALDVDCGVIGMQLRNISRGRNELEGTMELSVDWRCPTEEDEGEDDHGSDD